MRVPFVVAFLVLLGVSQAKGMVPKEVQAFIRNAEACEHFAGEFDGDLSEARKKQIELSVVKYCQRAQNQSKKLSAQYKNDTRIAEIIRSHTNESVSSFR
ncbi:hypothetical protein ACXZ1M_11020 [Duganella sp. PWIR1]